MKRLEKENPDCLFYFIIVTDLLPSLYLWDMGEKMLAEINFVIYLRQGVNIDLNAGHHRLPINYLTIDPSSNILGKISSTEVRKRIQELRIAMEMEKAF